VGSPGIDELRWLSQVRPGDTIRSEVEVIEARPSRSKPHRGTLLMVFKIRNQCNEVVLTMRMILLARRRPRPHSSSQSEA
jgi:acyl dehydratase